ncbi:MAG: LLM class flavin-dependent oxidoreductase [Dehalococcoidia bacterium]|jgi:FMN-dependent oxidoreductase (nitrilotriacetate monooxygenase family)|nr:LLM class flavin-dependent oxidoreductase [Dehalococcoidia bacterium]
MRQMSLVGFLQAQNCTTIPASWRHPEARTDSMSPDYYRHIGHVLERGKFDLGFFDDRLAMPDMYRGDHGHTVEHGIRCVKMDPVTVLMTMGMATKHLGLGATCSTTYFEPFDVARTFATVDLMTEGRAAWNVVTSVNDNEARNMGSEHHMAHDERYDQADEFMEVVLGHWDSWDDDAVLVDRKNGVFADPTKVRRLDHDGEHYRSRGPFTVPRSPQGHPVVIQAGSSPRGLAFGARWGELIFAAYGTIENAKVEYAAMKEAATSYGRDPDQMKIASLTFPVVAATRSEAVEKKAAYDELPNEIDQLPLLSEALNFDFASKGMDEAFSDEDLEGLQGMQALRDGVVRRSGIKNPTVRDFIRVSGRGRLGDGWVGSATEIADQLEAWFTEPACDGFVVGPTHIPGAFEDFVDLVVPELQRRGLYREEYTGTTLRDHLGLRMPSLRG